MSLVALWVVVALGAGILEVVVPAFGFVFVTLAALLAAVLALLAFGLTTQVVVFAASALLFLFVLRRFFVHRLRAGPGVPSRTEPLVGKHGEVTDRSIPFAAPGASTSAAKTGPRAAPSAIPDRRPGPGRRRRWHRPGRVCPYRKDSVMGSSPSSFGSSSWFSSC